MATRTLGLSGRDYSTLAAWASYANALSLSAHEFADFYNDGGAIQDTTTVTVGGWTANGFTVRMRPASGQGFGDNANKLTNALSYNASNGAALTSNVGYTNAYDLSGTNLVVEGLQFRATASSANSVTRLSGGVTINRSILSKASGAYIVTQGASGFTINDSLLEGAGHGVQCLSTGAAINNCTIASTVSWGTGVFQPYAVQPVVKNTSVYGFATDFQGTAGSGSTNNATDKGSFGGTGWGVNGQTGLSSADFENVSAGTSDWRIKSGSTKLINTGAGSVGTGFDVVNNARATNNIGAWGGASGGGGSTAQGATVTATASIFGGTATGGVASGTFTSEVLTRNNGTVAAGVALTYVRFYNISTGALVVTKTGLSTNGSGVFTTTDAALISGTTYAIDWEEAGGQRRMPRKAAT
jgi:hypothetical protein